MIVRALDADHDWTYGRGKNNYLSNNAAISQNIKTRLLSFLGDCFFDVAAGIDWWARLGGKSQLATELDIASVILNTTGVMGLVQLSAVLDEDRNLAITYQVTTIFTGVSSLSSIVGSANFLLTQDGIILTTEDGSPITT